MGKRRYCPCHRHTDYSFYDGMGTPKQGAEAAKRLGYEYLSIVDHGTMGGVADHYLACLEYGLKPIIGIEAYYQPVFIPKKEEPYYHMTLLALNQTGYKNLCAMMTESAKHSWFNKRHIFTREQLQKHHEGIIMLSGCVQGYIPQMIIKDRYVEADRAASDFHQLFGDRFYFEVMPFPVQNDGVDIQVKANTGVLQLARQMNIPVVMTGDEHFPNKEDLEAQSMLRNLGGKKGTDAEEVEDVMENIHQPENELPGEEAPKKKRGGKKKAVAKKFRAADYTNLYLHSGDEMAQAWQNLMGFDGSDYIEESIRIAERCQENPVVLKFENTIPHVDWGMSSEKKLLELCVQGLKEKGLWDRSKDQPISETVYAKRLVKEFNIFKATNFIDFLLLVHRDVVQFCKEKNIRFAARGSVCGSLAAYALGIHLVDPIKYGTIMEGFLHEEKKAVMPDIDMDIASSDRYLVVKNFEERYPGRCAQISNYTYYQTDSLINDMKKKRPEMNDFDWQEVKRRLGSINYDEAPISYEDLLNHEEEGAYFQHFDESYPRFLYLFTKLHGQLKNVSKHAAGLVITPGPIEEYMGLIRVKGDDEHYELQTMWDMRSIDAAGILKVDLLGSATWEIISKVEKQTGFRFSEKVLEDQAIYKAISNGDTAATFQLNGYGAIKVAKMIRPKNFDELRDILAINRPGPLSSSIDKKYVRGKNGKVDTTRPEYEILKDTYGLPLYQEQLLLLCWNMAGMPKDKTDKFIKQVSKKSIAPELKEMFIQGLVKNSGFTVEEAENLFKSFGSYLFKKNHAVGYAFISAITQYLTIHYPHEFYCAVLNNKSNENQKTGYNPREEIEIVARRKGIYILPPDINGSFGYDIVVDEDNGMRGIRRGLDTIPGLGETTAKIIVACRGDQPFTSYEDFRARTPSNKVNKRHIEALTRAGLLDFDPESYRQRFFAYERYLVDLIKNPKKKNTKLKEVPKQEEEQPHVTHAAN